jgi:hypothetical protein
VEFPLMPDDISSRSEFGDFGFGLRRHDGDVRGGAEQGSDLGSGDCTGADHEARAIFEFDEGRE